MPVTANRLWRQLPNETRVAVCQIFWAEAKGAEKQILIAWGGADDNVIRFRRGNDARSIPPITVKGEFTRDAAVMVGKIADVLSRSYSDEKVAMMFVDGSGVGGNAGAVGGTGSPGGGGLKSRE